MNAESYKELADHTCEHDLLNVTGTQLFAIARDIKVRYGEARCFFCGGTTAPHTPAASGVRKSFTALDRASQLAFWRAADVFAYLAQRGLPVHPAYGYLGGGRWARERLRVAEIGDTHGRLSGRGEWEQEYYGDLLHKIEHEAYRRRIG